MYFLSLGVIGLTETCRVQFPASRAIKQTKTNKQTNKQKTESKADGGLISTVRTCGAYE